MGHPLDDITIYYYGRKKIQPLEEIKIQRKLNYISDYYHTNLNGYKPPKTSRICLEMYPVRGRNHPIYFGSICSYHFEFDEEKFLSFSSTEKNHYILELIHHALLELIDLYNWDREKFITAYQKILDIDFKFEKNYPEKQSRDRKNVANAFVTKTEDTSKLSIQIAGKEGSNITKPLLSSKNWFWYDSIYTLAKACKWINSSAYGFSERGYYCYYSIAENKVVSNFGPGDTAYFNKYGLG